MTSAALMLVAMAAAAPHASMDLADIHAIVEERAIGWTAEEIRDIAAAIHEASARTRVDPRLVLGIMHTESHFKRNAISGVGARGLLQVMPATAKAYAQKAGVEWVGPETLHQPVANVHIGVTYFAWLLKRFDGNVDLALTAYCHGPYRVLKTLKNDGKLEDSIWSYSKKVRTAWKRFQVRANELALNDRAYTPES